MDYNEAKDILKLCESQVAFAKQYCEHRELAARAQYKIEVLLTSHLPEIREKKGNVGIEMATLMLMEEGFLPPEQRDSVLEYRQEFLKNEAKYKGLEHLIEAVKGKIMYAQSLMKFVKENT